MNNLYDFEFTSLQGNTFPMSDFKGKVLLIVNTASQCGFTPHYKGLQELQKTFKDRGFSVIGFPCNQFGGQEPGSSQDIAQFCEMNYQITFPMHEKIKVNGDQTHPLYQRLKKEAPGILGTQKIKWNFTKFLIGKDGEVKDRYGSKTSPQNIAKHIESLLD
jgi:glutathione peroxidase